MGEYNTMYRVVIDVHDLAVRRRHLRDLVSVTSDRLPTRTFLCRSLMTEVVIPPKRANGLSIELRVRGGNAVFNDP